MGTFGPQKGKLSKSLKEVIEKRRERSKRVFPFVIADIAEAVGRSVQTVHRAIKMGELDPRDLSSLSKYVMRYENRKKSGVKETK